MHLRISAFAENFWGGNGVKSFETEKWWILDSCIFFSSSIWFIKDTIVSPENIIYQNLHSKKVCLLLYKYILLDNLITYNV